MTLATEAPLYPFGVPGSDEALSPPNIQEVPESLVADVIDEFCTHPESLSSMFDPVEALEPFVLTVCRAALVSEEGRSLVETGLREDNYAQQCIEQEAGERMVQL